MPNSRTKKGSGKSSTDHEHVEEVSLTCACDRDITLSELKKIYSGQRNKKIVEEFLLHINTMLKTYGISSCIKKAHFLSQVGHESGQLSFLEEGVDEKYEKEKYGGYKGRGLIQLTFKETYQKYGDYKGVDFLGENRVKVASKEYAADSAGWFWTQFKHLDLSDYAEKNDFIFITQKINGAFNGWDDRLSILNRAFASLLVDNCPKQDLCYSTDFQLQNSAAFQSVLSSFAWGYWFDPKSPASKVKHVTRDVDRAKAGYARFKEIAGPTKIGKKEKRGNFGFKTYQSMLDHAQNRLVELEK
ncbi:glycoside hydrolase family 19 protein [Dechloromonas denitrificans]|uniref:glycoside hydrolase family 19 protein n=1 Tax=Dechloromonas denitrificans TaxID=281362 RepID=UPI001CF9EDD9|nr:hypothetical protein [Dechloromonas denitrificans]UCV06332.1 hypothetical protein KI615_12950 [Dechloromonas denitrificans]